MLSTSVAPESIVVREGRMLYDRSDLYDVAEQIATTEARIARLRVRVSRLSAEGSDTAREHETLGALNSNLSRLYAREARMRSLTWSEAASGWLDPDAASGAGARAWNMP
jgi:hypothetical protein